MKKIVHIPENHPLRPIRDLSFALDGQLKGIPLDIRRALTPYGYGKKELRAFHWKVINLHKAIENFIQGLPPEPIRVFKKQPKTGKRDYGKARTKF